MKNGNHVPKEKSGFLSIDYQDMPKTPPLLLPPFIDVPKQPIFINSCEQQAEKDELIEWDSFERLEQEYEQTYLGDNTKTVSSF